MGRTNTDYTRETVVANIIRVQSIRGVGSKKGYPYYAFGVYEPTIHTKTGMPYYRLVRSGTWFRSDVNQVNAFAHIPVVSGVRHGTPVSNKLEQ